MHAVQVCSVCLSAVQVCVLCVCAVQVLCVCAHAVQVCCVCAVQVLCVRMCVCMQFKHRLYIYVQSMVQARDLGSSVLCVSGASVLCV